MALAAESNILLVCSTCDCVSGTDYKFREMMLGLREEFDYWQCSQCRCIQTVKVPEDLARYYPSNYYSFRKMTAFEKAAYKVYFVARHWALLRQQIILETVLATNPKKHWRILDVGCGSGRLVKILRSLGLDAHGIDPFAEKPFSEPYLRRIGLDDVEKGWDLIMFHHSLEHMIDNISVLRKAGGLLATDGTCMVRIPLAEWAWEHYGRDWYQLDAPRHLTIHTLESFRLAADRAGLSIAKTVFDSGPAQFSLSEGYRRDVALFGEGGCSFSSKEMNAFRSRAKELNKQQRGDQACFYLKRKV